MYPNNKNSSSSRSWKRLAGFVLPAILLFTSLATVSCRSLVPQELTTNEKLWNAQSLKDYDFTLERQAFAPEDWRGPVNIQVRNGEAVAVTYVSTGAAVTEGKFDNANTIEKLFTMLEDAYAGNNEFQHRADRIDVTYNSQMGYPEDLYIDVSQKIADEEQGYSVNNFVARSASGTAVLQDRIVATALSQQGPQDPVEMEAFLDDLLQREMEEQHIAGAAVAIVKDGGLFFAKGYGYANLEKSIPVDPEKTNFRIGSVTKLFTWTAVMQLVEQGELDLNADINNYLDFRIPDTYPQPITLKNLMTHTPGFEDKQNGIMKNNPDEWIVISRPPNNRPWFRARILPRALRTIPEPIISRAIIFQRRKKSCYC